MASRPRSNKPVRAKRPRAIRPRRVAKPWGYELIWAENELYVGKILHIDAGQALSLQYHREKDETIHLLRGVLSLEVARPRQPRRRLKLAVGQSFRITPGLRHRMTAVEDCDVLEASTPQLDDVVRLEDRYGRVR
jgi:mannose-6-phosphate isomerase-like protein (cupin superfamily)